MTSIKILIFSIVFTNFTLVLSQGVVSVPELNVLYRGVQNYIEVGGGIEGKLNISVSGGIAVAHDKGWLITPNPEVKVVKISVSQLYKGNMTAMLGSWEYIVRRLPKPTIDFTRADGIPNQLILSYDIFAPKNLTATEIVSWTVKFEGEETIIKGEGDVFNEAFRKMYSYAPKETTFSLICTTKNQSDQTSLIESVFKK